MAFNLQTLKTRAITSAVFVIIMLLGLLWNQWSFFILFSIIHFGCWIEYQKLIGLIDRQYLSITPFHRYGVMLMGWCFMLYTTNELFSIGPLFLHNMGWWLGFIFVFVLPITELLFSKEMSLKNIGYSLLGLIYISMSWALMMDLRDPGASIIRGNTWSINYVVIIPLVLVLSLWANDTMAYLVGSWIGKTPFSKISPKKTWEGTLGGMVLCVALITLVFQSMLSWQHLLVISSIAAVTGTAGDLLESKLKRKADVKDSGQIMPGHGGFLDRFDSLLIATPFVWVYVRLFVY
ncbi:MAG TPA: phosphatidate cytidylyltransferase [Chitinophagaceae bacterium]|jgi:phosphatidate cytidylyltransferase|nr:phosphatidate cytidylyltransferase [Chitinophagaceae bacterium]